MELRKRRNSGKKMSAAMWVGYAADEETPEMIMRKFEILEKLKANVAAKQQKTAQQAGPGDSAEPSEADAAPKAEPGLVARSESPGPQGPNDVELTEQQLEKVFKLTSMFVVPKGSRDVVYDVGEGFQDKDMLDQMALSDDSSGDEEAFFDATGEKKPKPKRERRKRAERGEQPVSGHKERTRMKLVSMEVVGMDGYTYTVKKKVKVKDPLEPDYIRVPPLPLPTTWCRTVEPFSLAPTTPPPGSHYFECDVVDVDLLSLGRTFVGVLLDIPWRTSVSDGPGRVDASQLAHLKLDQVVPVGLAFVWAEKEVIADAVKLMASFGFLYVENMCWIRQYPNHSIVTEDYDYFTKSKCTLLIFKRGDGITLRHQRNPDVVFDIVRRDKYLTEDKPETTHDIIETLLPDGNYKDDANPGRFLELWGRRGVRRKGWTSLVQRCL